MKKIYSVILGIVAFVFLFTVTACQKQGPVTLKIAWPVDNIEELPKAMSSEGAINTYLENKQKPYRLQFEALLLSPEQNLADQLADFDLFYGGNYDFSIKEIDSVFLDLRPLLEGEALAALYKSMPATYWETLRVNEKIYSITRTFPPEVHSLWISRGELESLGITVPESLLGKPLDAWSGFFQQVYEANGQKPFLISPYMFKSALCPVADGNVWQAHFQMITPYLGISYEHPEEGVVCVFESEYAQSMNELWEQFFESGYVITSPLEMTASPLIMRSTASYITEVHDIEGTYTSYPLQEHGYSTNMTQVGDSALPYSLGLQVLKEAPNQEEALIFLNDLADNQTAREICAQEEWQLSFSPFAQYMVGVGTQRWSGMTEPAEENEALLREQYQNMESAPAVGFVLNTESIAQQHESIMSLFETSSDMGKVRHDPVRENVQNPEDWNAYISAMHAVLEQMKAAGLDSVVEEANIQLSQYKD